MCSEATASVGSETRAGDLEAYSHFGTVSYALNAHSFPSWGRSQHCEGAAFLARKLWDMVLTSHVCLCDHACVQSLPFWEKK